MEKIYSDEVGLAVLLASLTIFVLTTFGGAITGLMPASI